jgi:hypothetical protein
MNKGRNKSVRFECDTDISSCESSAYGGWRTKKTESPNPTPMKISEGMQTPGTVYPVKSQFVYPNNSLGEDVSKSKILEEEDYVPAQDSRKMNSLKMQRLHQIKVNLPWKKACLLG